MTAYLIEHPPRIRQFRERGTTPSGVIVVHTAESTPDWVGPDAGAENVAHFIATRTTYGSYHDLCDSDSSINLVPYHLQAYGDGTGSNPHAYHVSAATQAAKWNQATKTWREATVRNMARAAARYARWLDAEHGIKIPARRITRAQSEARTPGFISHGERDPGRRSDPGADFPWDLFLATFAAEIDGTPEEDDMKLDDIINPNAPEDKQMTVAQALRIGANQAAFTHEKTKVVLKGVRDLAGLVKSVPGCDAAMADEIATKVAAEVERLDAEAVAAELEIKPKGK